MYTQVGGWVSDVQAQVCLGLSGYDVYTGVGGCDRV